MTKSIAISAVLSRWQRQGGVSSIGKNILYGFHQLTQEASGVKDLNVTVFHSPTQSISKFEEFDYVVSSDRWGRFGQETLMSLRYGQRFDATLFLNYFTPPIVRSPRCVTVIHDLLYRHMPEMVQSAKRAWLRCSHELTLRKCDAVVTITEAVRQDVIEQYGSKWTDRVHAIWNPVMWRRYEPEVERTHCPDRPYLFSLAVDRPYKNLETLIRAFCQIKDRCPDYMLVLGGQLRSTRKGAKNNSSLSGTRSPSTIELVESLGIEDRVIVTGHVSDAELGALYRGATVFVLPSLFEGFGAPVVESLGLGTPVIASDLPPLREITQGEATFLVDSQDSGELGERILSLIRQGESARPSEEVVAKIRNCFEPARIAKQYLDVLCANGA